MDSIFKERISYQEHMYLYFKVPQTRYDLFKSVFDQILGSDNFVRINVTLAK